MTKTFTEIAELVRRASGIRLDATQHAALGAALGRAHPTTDPVTFLRHAPNNPRLMEQLLDELTVKETYFLRDRRQLDGIDWHVLAAQARSRGANEVRIWCAACATGEEPFSLALLASDAFAPAQPPVSILATDISGEALARAREGTYRARSVRDVEPDQRRRYFEPAGDQLVVGEQLRSLVTFAQHNLVTDTPPFGAPFDLILCRNVLIYFGGETVDQVLACLELALASDGTLILGAADALCASARRLAPVPPTIRRHETPSAREARRLRRPLGRAATPLSDEGDTGWAEFLRGLDELEAGDTAGAVRSLRRALFTDPQLALAAFTLGRAHEACGEPTAARRAYEQALRTLDAAAAQHDSRLGRVEADEVIAAARARLAALAP